MPLYVPYMRLHGCKTNHAIIILFCFPYGNTFIKQFKKHITKGKTLDLVRMVPLNKLFLQKSKENFQEQNLHLKLGRKSHVVSKDLRFPQMWSESLERAAGGSWEGRKCCRGPGVSFPRYGKFPGNHVYPRISFYNHGDSNDNMYTINFIENSTALSTGEGSFYSLE